jgi:hypothetical protein
MLHILYNLNNKVGMECYPTLERNKEFKACREEFIPHLTYKLFSQFLKAFNVAFLPIVRLFSKY